jgi:hypothetical protein
VDALEPSYINDLLRREIMAVRGEAEWDDLFQKQEAERGQIGELAKQWTSLFPTGNGPIVTDSVTDKRCPVCGTIANGKRSGSRYCSNLCRQSAYRQRMRGN